jgi:hypothetical protein
MIKKHLIALFHIAKKIARLIIAHARPIGLLLFLKIVERIIRGILFYQKIVHDRE